MGFLLTYILQESQRASGFCDDTVLFLIISDQMPTSSSSPNPNSSEGKLFNLKKWNAVAMWSWDVECDTCAICRVQVCNTENIRFTCIYSSFIRNEPRNVLTANYFLIGHGCLPPMSGRIQSWCKIVRGRSK